jgi:hypothetical protein
MSAPDFYFAVSAIFRHIHDRHGKAVLVDYWRQLGREHYASRWRAWRQDGLAAIASDWRSYFDQEPGGEAHITTHDDRVTLDIRTCPAIAHLRRNHRHIPAYFCEHCDFINSAMGEQSGHRFIRQGGMGSCTQHFVTLTTSAVPPAVSPTEPERPHARLS